MAIKVGGEFTLSQAPTVPFVVGVEVEESTFQTFGLVLAIHIPVRERGSRLRCSDNEMMVARCFIKSGYRPGDGLRRHFQGDPESI